MLRETDPSSGRLPGGEGYNGSTVLERPMIWGPKGWSWHAPKMPQRSQHIRETLAKSLLFHSRLWLGPDSPWFKNRFRLSRSFLMSWQVAFIRAGHHCVCDAPQEHEWFGMAKAAGAWATKWTCKKITCPEDPDLCKESSWEDVSGSGLEIVVFLAGNCRFPFNK